MYFQRAISPVPEVHPSPSSDSLNSPSKQSKDTEVSSLASQNSTEDSLDDSQTPGNVPSAPPVPEEPEPVDTELEIMDLIPWETAVRNQDPNFDFDSMSKKDRARQMVIHELINVHHNACVKIAFIVKIFKPTILARSALKEQQLTVCFPSFFWCNPVFFLGKPRIFPQDRNSDGLKRPPFLGQPNFLIDFRVNQFFKLQANQPGNPKNVFRDKNSDYIFDFQFIHGKFVFGDFFYKNYV